MALSIRSVTHNCCVQIVLFLFLYNVFLSSTSELLVIISAPFKSGSERPAVNCYFAKIVEFHKILIDMGLLQMERGKLLQGN